jgi:ketosteroid isomerase-like protein
VRYVRQIAGRARVSLAFALAAGVLGACASSAGTEMSTAQRKAIADTVSTLIVKAYDLSAPGDPVERLMSLYPQSGPVISASGGQFTTSRDTLESEIRTFWDNVGRNMRNPTWVWGPMRVDVLAPDAAVVTTTYRVPHLTPRGQPHVIAGAWTAVFQRQRGRWVIVHEHLSDLPTPMSAGMGAAMPDSMQSKESTPAIP